MSLRYLAISALLFMATQVFAQEQALDKGKLSYALGYQAGFDLTGRGVDVDASQFMKGLNAAISGGEPSFSKEEMLTILNQLQEKIQKEQMEKFKELALANKKKSEEFLRENSKKKGIVSLPSGVQYRVIEEGNGSKPKLTDQVVIHYRGSLMNGLEFDSSFTSGKPASFRVNEVLKGWQEVLPLMKTGAKWQVFVPPEMAYGLRAPRPIGPNEALQFDIHLLEIAKGQ